MKKLLCILLASAMLLSLCAGCGGGEDQPASPSPSESAGVSPEGSVTPDATEPVQADAYFPLDETVTLSWLGITNMTMLNYYSDFNELFFWQELEKRTNVHIDFTTYPSNEIGTQLALVFAGGLYPDLIVNLGQNYSAGLKGAYDEGVIEDLSEYIDMYMPNYSALLEATPKYSVGATLDGGVRAQVCGFYTLDKTPTKGFVMRGDWLEDIGVDYKTLRTYDQWHDVLTAFKVEKGADSALWISSFGGVMESLLSAGHGLFTDCFFMAAPFSNIDGTVVFSPLEDNFLPYLKMLQQWYDEGLIYQDYMSGGISFNDSGMMAEGRVGSFVGYASGMNNFNDFVEDENYYLVGVASPRLNSGDKLHVAEKAEICSGGISVGAGCKNIEVVCRWLDYLFSEEGHLLANYGVEGLTYEIDNGRYVITEAITGFEKGSEIGWLYYTMASANPFLEEFTRRFSTYTNYQVEAYETWGEDDADYVITLDMDMSAAELSEYSTTYGDIGTLTQEFINSFIVGEANEADYEAYRAEIVNMNIQRCIELKQAGVDRFLARKASAGL